MELYSDKLKDLYGSTLNTRFYDYYPFIRFEKENFTGRVEVYGVERQITEAVARAINFSFIINLQNVTSGEFLKALGMSTLIFQHLLLFGKEY